MDIEFEYIPEHYVGKYPSITIHRKMSQTDYAFQLESVIKDAVEKLNNENWSKNGFHKISGKK